MWKHQTFRQGSNKAKWWIGLKLFDVFVPFLRLYSTSVYTEPSTWTFPSKQSRSTKEMNSNKNHLHHEKWIFLSLATVLFPKWRSSRRQSVNNNALQTYVATAIWSSLTTSTTFSSSGSSSDWCPVPSWVGFSRKLCTKFWISPRASVAKKTGEIKTNHYHETLL